ncbi:ino eighty subunit 1 [Aspergillus udagawae]|nr:ino eighty subunit 1 [Aspergillus udagawae]GFG20293.1 ino eighty subunit 1 [Aspergillus udagawae]
MADVESNVADESFAQSETQDEQPSHSTVSATVGIRRQANGTIGSVYSGNKIRHLKKEDGMPLWRKDIQYQFLKLVFEDKTPVFTRWSDGKKNLDFADIYIDAMARSSKTSKILKDKLQSDKQAAINMAMLHLETDLKTNLVFPEMRAQLRTYHSIPSLQAHQDPNAYKQLQDAPRLKSILKGASEDVDQPNTLEKIKRHPIPRTNPVHLIFVLAQYAPKVSELHFFPPRDFFDLVMRSTLSSKSRARAFLWLMWWYLESDYSREAALNNPFGPGQDGEGAEGLPIKVPSFESLTEEQANEENVDTPSEIEYGETKRLERKRILEEDEPLPRPPKRPRKAPFDPSNSDKVVAGEGPPYEDYNGTSSMRPPSKRPADQDEGYLTPTQSSRSESKRPKRESSLNRSVGQQRLILKTKMEQTPDASSPAPPGSGHPILNRFVTESTIGQPSSARRPRPLTQHQLAVEQNRRQRIDYLLAKRKNEAYRILRAKRESEVPFARYGRLLQSLPEGYDTEDEEASWGKGGLIPHHEEEEDFGESAGYFLSVVRKAARRLDRWDYENANGPKRDRKKEREERQKARQNGYAMDALDLSGRTSMSARSRARAARNARRKLAEAEAGAAGAAAGGEASKGQTASSSRSKSSRSRPSRAAGGASSGVAGKDDLDVPSQDQELSPLPPSIRLADEDADLDGEGLDDLDRELLGEGSGDEDDAADRDDRSSRPAEPGYEDSFMGGDADDDAEALSSDDEVDDEEDLDDGDGGVDVDENSSTFEGGNGYAASETSSVAGDTTAVLDDGKV